MAYDDVKRSPIPMVDLHLQYSQLKREIDDSIASVLAATQFIMGENVVAFEAEAAAYLGVEHGVSCGNGTDALQLALRALDIGPGDEVITTPFTFIATAEAIASVGATPVFVDIDASTWLIDMVLVERAITPRTRAVLPVHLFGMPADMATLRSIADEHRLAIVEDCAQSFGASVDGRKTGSFGEVGCFSFFPSKNLGAFGDGGMLTTDDEAIADRLRLYRSHGSRARYVHTVLGCNSRLDEVQAAVLRQKLPHIDRFNRERQRVALRYAEHLSGLPLQLPVQCMPSGDEATHPVFHQFTVLTDRRDDIRAALARDDIASAIYYATPLHHQQAMRMHLDTVPLCPVAERICSQCLSLPIFPELDDASIARICAIVHDVLDSN